MLHILFFGVHCQSIGVPSFSSLNCYDTRPRYHHLPLRSAMLFRRKISSKFCPKLISTIDFSSKRFSHSIDIQPGLTQTDIDHFASVANKLADASAVVIRKYFRKELDVLHKDDLSPVTIADQAAEEAMVSIIWDNFPSHVIYGEENGWRRLKEKFSEFIWVLDPIDGTKSFITGKPLFGTLIALLHKGNPILGIIDQPILGERWMGISGRRTTLNGKELSTRVCTSLSNAYLYTTSPHLFNVEAEKAFTRVRSEVRATLYGCDCYAYALLATGCVDLVIESSLKPYDVLSLIPVVEGSGGVITDWQGRALCWNASPDSSLARFDVVAVGDRQLHDQVIGLLQNHSAA